MKTRISSLSLAKACNLCSTTKRSVSFIQNPDELNSLKAFWRSRNSKCLASSSFPLDLDEAASHAKWCFESPTDADGILSLGSLVLEFLIRLVTNLVVYWSSNEPLDEAHLLKWEVVSCLEFPKAKWSPIADGRNSFDANNWRPE